MNPSTECRRNTHWPVHSPHTSNTGFILLGLTTTTLTFFISTRVPRILNTLVFFTTTQQKVLSLVPNAIVLPCTIFTTHPPNPVPHTRRPET
ncbi:hypothetical protein P691DRAFT_813538 [Macrolepiota fuliginosa MF-IS2]|uniref:Uncharacterized protein n=1 Tax=Macrolepiota fuliginosa MF-IS2 TaxID=1400762 RepID=A0A9P5WZF2_9AGAR|nr:hypothetical protein P691DRAFT_813538 [Macrolepiota fuliginosa MF-IS2]